jgi:hypothetical protein
LNLGRKDGADAAEVVALLGGAGVSVAAGQVDLMNTHSYINIQAEDADRLCAAINGQDRNGRKLVCEAARPRR